MKAKDIKTLIGAIEKDRLEACSIFLRETSEATTPEELVKAISKYTGKLEAMLDTIEIEVNAL